MDRYPKKPCKFCGGLGHFPYACYENPKRKAATSKLAKPVKRLKQNKPLKQRGKIAKQWDLTRKTWIRKNPPPIEGKYWLCYLQISPQCPVRLDLSLLTLDHVVSRSRDPSKRFSLDNLQPACWWCNTLKGSRSVEQVRPAVLP